MGDHSIGAVEFLRAVLPQSVELAFVPITYLGDPWLLLFGLLGVYWFLDHRDGGSLLGLSAAGAGAIVCLKLFFALERPSTGPPVPVEAFPAILRPVFHDVFDQSTHAFPSGHAMGSTVAWGGAAWLLDVGRRRVRYLVAGVAVALVSLSRVVLGVHYAADVVAGVLFGVAFLVGAVLLVDRLEIDRWTGLFGVALAVGGVALAVSGFGTDAQLVVGAAVGALVVRHTLGVPEGSWQVSPTGVAYALGGFCLLLVPLAILKTVGVPGENLLGLVVGVAGATALPAVVVRLKESGNASRE